MKRILVLALLMALCVSGAVGEAAFEPRGMTMTEMPLLDKPDEAGKALMVYFPGVRVRIEGEAENGYVPVTVGAGEGSLSGYMREEYLVIGEEKIRRFRAMEAHYEAMGWTMYAQMDEASPVLLERSDVFLYVIGEMDGWVHAEFTSGHENALTTGFVRKPEGQELFTRYAWALQTEPLPGEVTREEAVAFAIEKLVADGEMANGQPGVRVTREMLEGCDVYLDAQYDYGDRSLMYIVSFIYKDRTFEDGFPMPCAFVDMTIEGDQIVRYGFGNG